MSKRMSLSVSLHSIHSARCPRAGPLADGFSSKLTALAFVQLVEITPDRSVRPDRLIVAPAVPASPLCADAVGKILNFRSTAVDAVAGGRWPARA
jgi:hypothetical protein